MARCACHRELDPPTGRRYLHPAFEPEPGPAVRAVAFVEDDPTIERAVRVVDGWEPRGFAVDYYQGLTPAMVWESVGTCWAKRIHPVVVVEPGEEAEPIG